MKTVLLLGGPAAGQRVEVHGAMRSVFAQVTQTHSELYNVVPMCSHGEVHWFGVLDGADPLALLIAGYGAPAPQASRMVGLGGGKDSATVPSYDDRQPTRVEVRSATKLEVDKFGSAHVVPDFMEARRLIGQGFTQVAPDTFRKEFYE